MTYKCLIKVKYFVFPHSTCISLKNVIFLFSFSGECSKFANRQIKGGYTLYI